MTCSCGQSIALREIVLYTGLFNALGRVYGLISSRGAGYRFKMRDVRHLLGRTEYCRFGDLALSDGLVFKEGKAKYGLNLERCRDFFCGNLAVATRLWKNPVTGEISKEDYRTVGEIPKLREMLDSEGLYAAKYTPSLQMDLIKI